MTCGRSTLPFNQIINDTARTTVVCYTFDSTIDTGCFSLGNIKPSHEKLQNIMLGRLYIIQPFKIQKQL